MEPIRKPHAGSTAMRLAMLLLFSLLACLIACSCSASQDDWQTCEVELSGGTGRASVQSPAQVRVEDDSITARVVWSSSDYDLMVVDGKEYMPVTTEGGSTFEIPVSAFDTEIPVQAETTAMSTPHMIDYTLRFDSSTLSGDKDEESNGGTTQDDALQGKASEPTTSLTSDFRNTDLQNDWQPSSQMDLQYAQEFTVDYYENGCKLVCTATSERYLIAPEGFDQSQLETLPEDVQTIVQPAENVYLAATNAPCLFDALGITDRVGMLSMTEKDCSVESFKQALGKGTMQFGGKYNAPDYELIVDKGCKLAIESTMINHNPEVKEKLEELGITVLTELSSYEPQALGRLEWIKLYGAIFDKEDQANAAFDEQARICQEASQNKTESPTVAFFYINSNGSAVTRMPGDYIAQMIGIAGGEYIFNGLGESEGANSTVTLEMESFFAQARDADVIIYNATIDGGVESLNELVSKNPLLGEFKAVKYYNVWCTDADMYQQMISTGEIVDEMNRIFAGTAEDDMEFFKKLD